MEWQGIADRFTMDQNENMKNESLNKSQDEINAVWGKEWSQDYPGARALFQQRIFIEGYQRVRAYVPSGVRTILDIGAATGRYSAKFAQDFPRAQVYATDIVDSALGFILLLKNDVGVENLHIQKEDASSLTFNSSSIDVVYSGMVIQGLPDVPQAVHEMHRVLKPGGLAIVSTVNFWNFHTLFKWYVRVFNRPREYYGEEVARSPEELKQLFESQGFEVLALDGFYPAYGIYRLKRYWAPAALIGKMLNRINRLIDPWTGRYISRHFGFEIFVVARKK